MWTKGLSPAEAAGKIAALLVKAAQLQESGVGLKDEGELLLPPGAVALPGAD
jgi:hypothetical protein